MQSPTETHDTGVVLIVDDDPDIRDVLATVLEIRGFHTATAQDGVAALAAMHAEKPAIVVADLMMPNMSGAELLQSMKQDPELADVPVLLVTAWPVNAGGLGAAELLSKPVDIEKLLVSIRKYWH